MSKSYYLFRKNNQKTRDLVSKEIEKENFFDAKNIIDEINDGIMLYSVSAGWKVIIAYHHREKKFEKTLDSFIDYVDEMIKSGDYILKDEYGTPFHDTSIIREDVESHKNGMSASDYYSMPEHEHEYELYNSGPGEEAVGDVRFAFYEFF